MVLVNLLEKRESHRCRNQAYGHLEGNQEAGDKLRDWD